MNKLEGRSKNLPYQKMKRFITIYIDIETGEILNINKYNRKDYDIELLEKKWKYEFTQQTLTCIYAAKPKKQLKIIW